MHDRAARMREAAGRRYDVIIVGGGINGAGIARDAAERGLSVLLLDQHDWGFGTTWRSTKLIHGGLRYLEHGELSLVFESLQERNVLLRTAPHLVRPMPFLLPVYDRDRHTPIALDAGLTAYDLLGLGGGLPRHRKLAPAAATTAEPHLRRDGLRGVFGYWDAQVALPERLCLENVLRARNACAEAIAYARVERLLRADSSCLGVQARDLFSGLRYEFRALTVVNAAGPWIDELLCGNGLTSNRLGGTRGAHLVLRFRDGGPRRALYGEAPHDHRPFFVIPWRGVHLVGTTDVRISSPSETRPNDDEISYLMEAVTSLLPRVRLTPTDVWYAFAGIRPLPFSPDRREGAISRRHHIIDHENEGILGLYSVVGGKLSTYRNLAEHVTDRLLRALGRAEATCSTRDEPLVPGAWRPDPHKPGEVRLWQIYGAKAGTVLRAMHINPGERATLCPHTRDTIAQARHAVRQEGALTVAEVLLRRTPAGWARCLGLDAAPSVARVLADEFSWDESTEARARRAYRAEALATFRPGAGAVQCFN